MIAKVLIILGIRFLINIIALMFLFYFPYIMAIIYFAGGVVSRIILSNHKFTGGIFIALPGILLISCFGWNNPLGFTIDHMFLIMLILLPALLGSFIGLRISYRLGGLII
jgi:hypothetical protein